MKIAGSSNIPWGARERKISQAVACVDAIEITYPIKTPFKIELIIGRIAKNEPKTNAKKALEILFLKINQINEIPFRSFA
jgi:tRNA-binding EMAP/Myf-like protein